MTELDIAISSIKYTISCDSDEAEAFENLSKSLNQKTNKMMMDVGKFNDRLLLFIVLLINANKNAKIINNFEENVVKLLKEIQPILNSYDNLDSQLVMASIIKENESMLLPEYKIESNTSLEELEKIIVEKDKTNDEIVKIFDEVINFVETLANNINK